MFPVSNCPDAETCWILLWFNWSKPSKKKTSDTADIENNYSSPLKSFVTESDFESDSVEFI